MASRLGFLVSVGLSAGLLVAVGRALAAEPSSAPGARNAFFAFCMDTHDAKNRSLEEQAAMLKELGFDGLGHLWPDRLPERLKTVDAAGLKLFQVYVRVSVAADAKPPYDPRIQEILPLLKDRDAMLAPLVVGANSSEHACDGRRKNRGQSPVFGLTGRARTGRMGRCHELPAPHHPAWQQPPGSVFRG